MSVPEPSFENPVDFEDVNRDYIDTLTPCIIKSKDGRVVWNNEDFAFLQGSRPETVNAKLWRQSQLCLKHGLFKVTEGLYQVRGFDLSNISFVEGSSGVIVIDPLVSSECARAAFDLYQKHRGQKSVKAVIYTHSHIDHFGGATGVLPESPAEQKHIPIIAPENFLKEALGENVFAGPAMRRRAMSMYGTSLPHSPDGLVGCGLGLTTSTGSTSLIPPTDTICTTGEERTIDGTRIIFQMVPETEAPSEFNLFLPEKKALCISECATHCLHNITTLRGALVRDAKRWSKHLDETLTLYGSGTEVQFAGHHWPLWGRERVIQHISEQRDLYAYLHDQTVRLMNQGLNGVEIAEQLQLPATLHQKWHTQGFYGSVSHNVKGIYQRYMTWFDGNPANLWKHPPAEEGKRYVGCMGGLETVLASAKKFAGEGDLRFAATLLDHAVAAEPENGIARTTLADVYEQLGYGAENATWRNFYLTGAATMRKPPAGISSGSQASGVRRSLGSVNPQSSIEDWFDALAVQLDGSKASDGSQNLVVNIEVPDEKTMWTLRLSNAALTHRCTSWGDISSAASVSGAKADLSVTLTKPEVYQLLAQGVMTGVEKTADGNVAALTAILELCGVLQPKSREQSRL